MIIAMDFMRSTGFKVIPEFSVTEESKERNGNTGYVDLAFPSTGEVYEVKNYPSRAQGREDVAWYISRLNLHDRDRSSVGEWFFGASYLPTPRPIGLWPIGVDPSYLLLVTVITSLLWEWLILVLSPIGRKK